MAKNNQHNRAAERAAEKPVSRQPVRRRLLQGLLAGLLAVNILFFILALKPGGQRAREQAEVFRELGQDLESRRETVKRLRNIAANLGQARHQGLEFHRDKFLPKPTGFSILMEEVDKLARANRVRKSTVTYSLSDVQGQPELNEVHVTTVLEGDYANIVEFVNQVERSPQFMIIDNIALAGGGNTRARPGASKASPVRLSLRLVTFFQL